MIVYQINGGEWKEVALASGENANIIITRILLDAYLEVGGAIHLTGRVGGLAGSRGGLPHAAVLPAGLH